MLGSQGELYLNIVSVHNTVNYEGLLIQVVIEGDDIHLEETPPLKKKSSHWNTELALYVNKSDRLTLNLLKYGLLSNTRIGGCPLNLKTFKDNQVFDILVKVHEEQNIEVRLIVKYTPYIAGRYSEKHQPFRVHLERPFYYPGDTIRGHVVLNIKKPTAVSQVCLTMHGKSHVLWVVKKNKSYAHYPSVYNFMRHQVILYQNALNDNGEYTIFNPNFYIFPFEFTLGMDVQPTINILPRVYINSYVSCEVRYGKSKYLKHDHPFLIVKPYIPRGIIHKANYEIKGKDHDVKIILTIPDNIKIGEKEYLTIKIVNNSDKLIENVEIKLKNKIIYGAKRFDEYFQRNESKNIKIPNDSIQSFLPLQPGSEIEKEIEYEIPNKFMPTIFSEQISNIQNRYYFKIIASTEGNIFTRSHIKLKKPVEVVKRYHSLKQLVPLPSEPKSNPYQFRISKMITEGHSDLIPPIPFKYKDQFYKNTVLSKDIFDKNIVEVDQTLIGDVLDYNEKVMLEKMEQNFNELFLKKYIPNQVEGSQVEIKEETNEYVNHFNSLGLGNINDLSILSVSLIDHNKLIFD